MREELASKYIRGRGIEIGGLHCPLPVPLGAKVTYVDRLPPGVAHPDVVTKVHDVVIDDAEVLFNFDHGTQDFIIANHVIEHLHDPIGTLRLWSRRLVRGGIIYAAVPEKTQTFDRDRKVTTLEHLIRDAAGVWRKADADHYREWLSLIDKIGEPELTMRVDQCLKDRSNIHFHVWDEPAMREFLKYMETYRELELVEFVPNGAEVIWILRKK